ncbi:SseB protein N-terminal domain-containing protein [Thermomonospora echinospora]|uniref:SseB protein N-terminal domain-containing protein n=1 Tax=Thermomonospora echinospora TaxID=1992 RepID=A0A1H5SJ42_9ACTN|nr:SseB family protein [Thermomonospora echinospora]SEF50639.1 SseB protein N-terminal domain-containing protein [Thermomonospora echinospora]
MAGPSLIQPQFPNDDGSADPALRDALAGYAAGRLGEHAVLERLSGVRLLIPVVAILTEEEQVAPGELRREKHSEMATPTLIGEDGRRGFLGFTSMEAMRRWRSDARPVPALTRDACRSALDQGAHALVVDVAGPVPFAVDGLRLHLLAEGRPVPPPHEDPEVLAAVDAAFGGEPGIRGVRVGRGESAELAVRCAIAPGHDERAVIGRASDRLAELLRGRIVGGVELIVSRGALG